MKRRQVRHVEAWTRPRFEPMTSVVFPLNPGEPGGAALLLHPLVAAELNALAAQARGGSK